MRANLWRNVQIDGRYGQTLRTVSSLVELNEAIVCRTLVLSEGVTGDIQNGADVVHDLRLGLPPQGRSRCISAWVLHSGVYLCEIRHPVKLNRPAHDTLKW